MYLGCFCAEAKITFCKFVLNVFFLSKVLYRFNLSIHIPGSELPSMVLAWPLGTKGDFDVDGRNWRTINFKGQDSCWSFPPEPKLKCCYSLSFLWSFFLIQKLKILIKSSGWRLTFLTIDSLLTFLSAVTHVCVCVYRMQIEAQAETRGQTLSMSTSLHVSLGWQPCVRVSALCSRWPSQLLPGSPSSQRSLTRDGVLTAWGPVDSLL